MTSGWTEPAKVEAPRSVHKRGPFSWRAKLNAPLEVTPEVA